jgi:hypothetical protein
MDHNTDNNSKKFRSRSKHLTSILSLSLFGCALCESSMIRIFQREKMKCARKVLRFLDPPIRLLFGVCRKIAPGWMQISTFFFSLASTQVRNTVVK